MSQLDASPGWGLQSRLTALLHSQADDAVLDERHLQTLNGCWQERIEQPHPWAADSGLAHIISHLAAKLSSVTTLEAPAFSSACELVSRVCQFAVAGVAEIQAAPNDGKNLLQSLTGAMQLPASILPTLASCLEAISPPADTHTPVSTYNAVLTVLLDVVRLADAALFCESWLSLAGSAVFSETRDGVRGMLKGPLTRMLVRVVMSAAHTQVPQIQAVYSGLRNIAQSAAARINSSSSSTGAGSSEMRSFGVVNDAWAALVATITAVSASSPTETRFDSSGWDAGGLLATLMQNVVASFGDLLERGQSNQLIVVRFWLQHLGKVAASAPAHFLRLLPEVVESASTMCSMLLPKGGDSNDERWQALLSPMREQVFEKLCNAMLAALSQAPAAVQEAALCNLWSEPPPTPPDKQQQPLPIDAAATAAAAAAAAGRLQVILIFLSCGATQQVPLQLALARSCLPAAFDLTCGAAYPVVLASRELRRQICLTVLSFMASCNHRSKEIEQLGGSWTQCQAVLLAQALQPHPLRLQLLADVWCWLIRRGSDQLFLCHVAALRELLLGAAVADATHSREAGHPPGTIPLLRQLAALLGYLLRCASDSGLLASGFVSNLMQESSRVGTCDEWLVLHAHSAELRALRLSGRGTTDLGLGVSEAEAALVRHSSRLGAAGLATEGAMSGSQSLACCGHMLCCMEWLLICPQLLSQAAAFTLRKELMEAVPHLLAEEHIRCQPQLAVLALRLLLRLDISGMPAELAQLQPRLTAALANPQVSEAAAAMAAQCGLVLPPPAALFHRALMQPHWAEQHTAVQSLATYLRSAVHTDGLGCVVPPALLAHSNGSKESQFVATFRDTYLKRSPAVSDSPSMSGRDGVCLQEAAAQQIAWLQQAVGWAEGQLEISNSSAHKGEVESALVAVARAVQAVERLDRVMASCKGRDVLISDTRLVLALRGITQKATNLESRLAL